MSIDDDPLPKLPPVAAFRDTTVWRALQRNGMARDFGWGRAAREYAAAYTQLVRS